MKRNIMLLLCAAALIVTALVLQNTKINQEKSKASLSSVSYSYYFNSKVPSSQENSSTVAAGTKQEDHYLIKDFNGYIAVFKNDDKEPYRIYDKRVDTLPVYDQKKVISGIYKNTFEEVESQLEDFDC